MPGSVGCIVQARMSSTRLPGKTLMLINGKPMLWLVVERLKQCKQLQDIVVATSSNEKDKAILEFCKENKIKCFVGSENDVLERFFKCAKKHGFKTIVRITSDCPLIDGGTVDRAVQEFKKGGFDYLSNIASRSFPRGLDVEVFSFNALERAFSEAKSQLDREHVTHYIYSNREKFSLKDLKASGKLHRPELKLSVDTVQDLELLEKIFSHFKSPLVSAEEAIAFVDKNLELAALSKGAEEEFRQRTKRWKQGFSG